MEDQILFKIIAPLQSSKTKRPFWSNIGVSGMKNGRQWLKFNVLPTNWDGYAMVVKMDGSKQQGHDSAEQAEVARGAEEEHDEPPPRYGGEEGPGF